MRPGSNKALSIASQVAFVFMLTYLGVCSYLYFRQTHFLFVPNTQVQGSPLDFGCSFEEVRLAPNALQGYWMGGQSAKTVIYFHGNQGNIGDYSERACALRKLGLNVLLFDYRGYGNSIGQFPSEKRVYDDAEAAWSFVTTQRQHSPPNIILYGHSLGAAVAIEMASRHQDIGGLVAEGGFTSIYDVAILDPVFRLFPVSLILNQRMDSIAKVPALKMPKLFIHGDSDFEVPAYMSNSLFEAAAQPKRFVIVPRAGHDDVASAAPELFRDAILDLVGATDGKFSYQ